MASCILFRQISIASKNKGFTPCLLVYSMRLHKHQRSAVDMSIYSEGLGPTGQLLSIVFE